MGNCIKQIPQKSQLSQQRKLKDGISIKELVEEAEKREEVQQQFRKQQTKDAGTKNQPISSVQYFKIVARDYFINCKEEDTNSETQPQSRKKSKKGTSRSSERKKSDLSSDSNKRSKGMENEDNRKSIYLGKLSSENVPNDIRNQIEEQRFKCEATVKEQITELNLEKNISNSAFQLLRDYLSHIKDTKKYWVSLRLLGYSKAENNEVQVGGSFSFVVEYNTGETTKLRIVHSKDIDKANYDLDTFVFYSNLKHPNIIVISDFNFRISAKFQKYYIFCETAHHETSIAQAIQKQSKTEKPQISGAGLSQMFKDLLDVLNYFSSAQFIHGGIKPSNIYIQKQLEKDGRYIQKAFLDISLSSNNFNRRNTKYREYAFKKSSDLQMFAISILSLISSMDIDSVDEATKKPIILAKLAAPSIIQVENDIRYALSCILKGSDMILEFGAPQIKSHLDNSTNYQNNLGLERPNQQKNSLSFNCWINSNSEIIVYSFYTKWAFGYRIYERLEYDKKVNVRMIYCNGDILYLIYECSDNSDLFLTRINLRKKCLDNKSLSLIKNLSEYISKFQGTKTEEEIDILRAFESIDSRNEGFINADSFMQFALENKFKDNLKGQAEELTHLVSCFDEQDKGKLDYYEFKNMIQYILCSRPFLEIQIKDAVEVPRHYQPASIIKKGNYLYLVGGMYQSLPTNKCYRYFLKNIKAYQELSPLDHLFQGGFLADIKEENKIIFWGYSKRNDFFSTAKGEEKQSQVVKINVAQIMNSEHKQDAYQKKNNNIIRFQNSIEMQNALQSQKSLVGINDYKLHPSITSQLHLTRTMSFPIILQVEQEGIQQDINNGGIVMNVYNIEKNKWSHCLLESNEILNSDNFILPFNNKGQILIFQKENYQRAWLVTVRLEDIIIHTLPLFFGNPLHVVDMIKGIINLRMNVVFYENSLLCLCKPSLDKDYFYSVFVINEETGKVTSTFYKLFPYLSQYERISKLSIRFQRNKRMNSSLVSSQTSIISLSLPPQPKGSSKMKIQRYISDKMLAKIGETTIFSAYRSSMPNVDIKIFQRNVNNTTEKIDDIYESLRFLSNNQLQNRLPVLKDAFFIFDSNFQIKLNFIFTSDEVGQTMAEVIQMLHNQRNDALCRRNFKKTPSFQFSGSDKSKKKKALRKNKFDSNDYVEGDEEEEKKTFKKKSQFSKNPKGRRLTKKMSKILSQAHRSGSFLTEKEQNKQRKEIEFPSRLHELITSLRNVLICSHILSQHRFFMKDVSPHTLIRGANGKFFAPLNFFQENTFTTINSEVIEPILSENSQLEDYLSPQLLSAHQSGQSYNDISYNIHKANIYSLGLVFLQYASLKKIKGFNYSDTSSQIKLSVAINSLPYPKYVQEIFMAMLKLNEDERPSAVTILDLIHNIMDEHKIDIYFPQLSELSPFRQNSPNQPVYSQTCNESAFFYTLDNPNSILYLGGKQSLFQFLPSFKLDNKIVLETKQIIGITKYSEGFYAIIKFIAKPSDQNPQSQLRYLLIKLVNQAHNQKQLAGTLIYQIYPFQGRDIHSVNMFAANDSTIIIFGGEEISSIGSIQIKEVFQYDSQIKKNNQDIYEEESSEALQLLTRLDDLRNGVIHGQLIAFDPHSNNYRFFDNKCPSEEFGNDDNILERSESEESDEDQSYHQESEEEEEKKDNNEKGEDSENQNEEIKYEYFVLNSTLIKGEKTKYKISVQAIRLDGSVEQKYISVKINSLRQDKLLNQIENQPKEIFLQFFPLSDSLVIAMDIENPEYGVFLLSLISMKSIYIQIEVDIQDNKVIPILNPSRLKQKSYFSINQKSFQVIFVEQENLISHTYELDIEHLSLHLTEQAIIQQKYRNKIDKEEELPQVLPEKQVDLKQNRIILPQLTIDITHNKEKEDTSSTQKSLNFLNLTEKITTPNSFLSQNSPFDRIQEVPEDDETPFNIHQIEKSDFKSSSENQQIHQRHKSFPKFSSTSSSSSKSKLGQITQKDSIEEDRKEFKEIKKKQRNISNEDSSEKLLINVDNDEEEKYEKQSSIDIQNIINGHIKQNRILLQEKSLELSPKMIRTHKISQEKIDFYSGKNGIEVEEENKVQILVNPEESSSQSENEEPKQVENNGHDSNRVFKFNQQTIEIEQPSPITNTSKKKMYSIEVLKTKEVVPELAIKSNSFFNNEPITLSSRLRTNESLQKSTDEVHKNELLIIDSPNNEEGPPNYYLKNIKGDDSQPSSQEKIKLNNSFKSKANYKRKFLSSSSSSDYKPDFDNSQIGDDFNMNQGVSGDASFDQHLSKDNCSNILMLVEDQ